MMKMTVNNFEKESLEELYVRLNRVEFIHPDPLELVRSFHRKEDREIAGLLAAVLAYGQAGQIVKYGTDLLGRMGESPYAFVTGNSWDNIHSIYETFKYRWTTGDDVTALLTAIRAVLTRFGSIQGAFMAGFRNTDETVLPAMSMWVGMLNQIAGQPLALLSCPERGSACKRLNLYLRWMVRKDEVDIGGWTSVPTSKLIIPLDVHMFRLAKKWRLTRRTQADMKAALDVTAAFRKISPDDPVKYDFALTRLGIRRNSKI